MRASMGSGLVAALGAAAVISGCAPPVTLALHPRVVPEASPVPLRLAVAGPTDGRALEQRTGLNAPATFALVVAGYSRIEHTGARLSALDDIELERSQSAYGAPTMPRVIASATLRTVAQARVFADTIAIARGPHDDIGVLASRARAAGADLVLTVHVQDLYVQEWAATSQSVLVTSDTRYERGRRVERTTVERRATWLGTEPVESVVLRFEIWDVRGAPRQVWRRAIASTRAGAREHPTHGALALTDALTRFAAELQMRARRGWLAPEHRPGAGPAATHRELVRITQEEP